MLNLTENLTTKDGCGSLPLAPGSTSFSMKPEILYTLEELRTRILEEANEQDGHVQGEVLSGNTYKEQSYRSAAAGLRMAAGIVTEELECETEWQRINAMTPEELRAELRAAGHTDKELDASIARLRETAKAALARRSNNTLSHDRRREAP